MSVSEPQSQIEPPIHKGPTRTPPPAPGTLFGRWMVLGVAPDRRYLCPRQIVVHRMMYCRCECGVEREVALFRLRQGTTRSCGNCKYIPTPKRITITPGTVARRPKPKVNTGQNESWKFIRELRPTWNNTGTRQKRVLLCRCEHGHDKAMEMGAFRGAGKRLPVCVKCQIAHARWRRDA